jgi:regulator of cell morphogenesis and NO signaling
MSSSKNGADDNVLHKTIGKIVADDYRAAKVFQKYKIDFCCGGNLLLQEACRNQGIEPDAIIAGLAALQRQPTDHSKNYTAWKLPFLVDYIINVHHSYINEHGPNLSLLAEKTAEVHGERHPELREIATIFSSIMRDLKEHLHDEEETFFPAIKRLSETQKEAVSPDVIRKGLDKLRIEHEAVGEAIHAIRRLSRDFQIPADACNTYTIAYRSLEEFEDDLHQHVHLENNILFPKVEQLLA